ncbi:MAG TPA: ANTAR domain-containing protein [Mycobacteriales bacterium]|nr:ANTAR domain-containing protein [Mycobacteriales bacterium]
MNAQASASALEHPAIDAALRTTMAMTGMELAYVAALDGTTFTITRSCAEKPWPPFEDGFSAPQADSMCHRLLNGAPWTTSDAASDPLYKDAPLRSRAGYVSYAGVPVAGGGGVMYGALCAADRGHVTVEDAVRPALKALSQVVTAHLLESATVPEPGPTIRRVDGVWTVHGPGRAPESADDLTSAMVLADLLAAELDQLDGRGPRPSRPGPEADELTKLRLSVTQLEHALAARVIVEQAIGVLAERRQITPRAAFESLRSVARGSGRRVHDLAHEVVKSASGSSDPLPASLARAPRMPSPAQIAKIAHRPPAEGAPT